MRPGGRNDCLHEKMALGPLLSRCSDILRRMDDQRDPHYHVIREGQPAPHLDPGEVLGTFRREGVEWLCELVFRGESYGWKCRGAERWRPGHQPPVCGAR
jgi:hypothetical protein